MNLPNKLTLARILLIPVMVGCFYLPGRFNYLIAAAVFLLAYITDALDGKIARKRNIVTNFGKLMDPIADKLLSCSAFVMLLAVGLISPIAIIIVLAREFLISGLRLIAVEQGIVIAASFLGKLKTVSQFIAIMIVLIWPYFNVKFPLDQIMLWLSVVITIWSGVDYMVKNKFSSLLK
ncbi:CDP-diacylglycerol--glycerol-3-phosphate 3-phosphatidyltransferase [Eubacteriales bacterium OttesenSCG-928-K08]|nr:CDP-diacylglycerol--glycerol-3-phosphate 3-phosphatidyltransferase [Eubacteriales bacterium OttesenSCG-928-K08]